MSQLSVFMHTSSSSRRCYIGTPRVAAICCTPRVPMCGTVGAMSNAEIHKGVRRLLGVDFQGYDGTNDVVTPMATTVTPSNAMNVTAGPSNREVYVSIPSTATIGALDVTVDLQAQIPGPGGVQPAFKFVRYHLDTIIPPDLRGATSRPIGPEEPTP